MREVYDLRSDTAIQPTAAMVESLKGQYFADDLLSEDAATQQLLDYVCEAFGKEAALFTPTGTMSNQIAAAVVSRPGSEIVLGSESHIYNLESGGLAANSGVQVRAVGADAGEYRVHEIESALRTSALQVAPTSAVFLESTYNLNAGHVSSLRNLQEIREVVDRHGAFLYMDGARVFNAAEKLGAELSEIAQYVDALQFCLNKGLGGPLGSILVGTSEFVREAAMIRQRLGGGMRHTGFIAGPSLLAFEDWRDRMAADRAHAAVLASALRSVERVTLMNDPVETNIVSFSLAASESEVKHFEQQISQRGIHVKPIGAAAFRAVTHSSLSADDVAFCAEAMVEVLTAVADSVR